MFGSGRMLGWHRYLYHQGLRDFSDEAATPGRNLAAPHTKQHGRKERVEIDEREQEAATNNCVLGLGRKC